MEQTSMANKEQKNRSNTNKPKLSTKEKQKKKVAKLAAKRP
jgi:hypothetical protein